MRAGRVVMMPPVRPARRLLRLTAVAILLAAARFGPARAHDVAEPLPAAAAAVVARRFPGRVVLAHVAGALHADGARDEVVVLGRGGGAARLVSVLWQEAGGGYRFADASGDIDGACAGCEVAVRIRERVLEVSASDAHGARFDLRTWRFAYRGVAGNVLRLVGVRDEQVSPAGDGGSVDDAAGTDLLTGIKTDVIEGDVQGLHRRLEATSRVPLRQPILFGQFAFDPRGSAAETRFVFGRDFQRR